MISDIRTYFRDIIEASFPVYKEWGKAFNSDNIPRGIRDKSYWVDVQETTSQELDDQFIRDETAVQVYIFHKAKRDEQKAEDDAFDDAHLIRKECVTPTNAMTGTYIKNVICDSISKEETDDNSKIIVLSFTVLSIYSL